GDEGAHVDAGARGGRRQAGARGDRLAAASRRGPAYDRCTHGRGAECAPGADQKVSFALPSSQATTSGRRHTFILDAVRTPFGRYGGALAGVRPDDLAAHALKALLDRTPSLDPEQIDDVLLGDANGAGEDNRDVARMAALLAGLPTTVPGATVNRLCGSSLEASIQGSRAIECGDASIVVTGGVESMSR